MPFIASILPVVLYILVVYELDNFSLISVKRLLVLVGCGMVSALLCFGLFYALDSILSPSQTDFVYPVLEEAMKAIPLLYLARHKKMVFFI